MKIAISLPDATVERATRSARELGVSRSQLVATALTRYLDDLERTSLVEDINRAVDLAGDDSNDVAAAAGRRRLTAVDDEWWSNEATSAGSTSATQSGAVLRIAVPCSSSRPTATHAR